MRLVCFSQTNNTTKMAVLLVCEKQTHILTIRVFEIQISCVFIDQPSCMSLIVYTVQTSYLLNFLYQQVMISIRKGPGHYAAPPPHAARRPCVHAEIANYAINLFPNDIKPSSLSPIYLQHLHICLGIVTTRDSKQTTINYVSVMLQIWFNVIQLSICRGISIIVISQCLYLLILTLIESTR